MLKNILSSIFGLTKTNQNPFEESYIFSEEELKDIDPFYEIKQIVYQKNYASDKLSIPKIIFEGRNKYNGEKLADLHSRYFQTMPVKDGLKPFNLNSFILQIEKSLLLVEPMVQYEKLCWNNFHIKSVPVIEHAIECFQILADSQKIVELKEMLEYIPELNFYLDDAQRAEKFCFMLPSLLDFIKSKQGATIRDFAEKFPNHLEIIKPSLYYLAKYDILKKKKVGRYNFYEIA
ncbi:hypothetical protein [Sunxiuqinia elliptica]|uniref:Uncharacterized protein n=1 Tax=Sunxiuqinia elliptica TaxID=655355 RepID=A0A4R6GYQ1_9BACT|nr:hypothetical protein [Sunxiuqinia elliptica]TDN99994.1 hypothetical protein DET52_106207 [Sunxiuqinia elliptica]TDO57186.1 hypothetical protein DET65_3771 [Sunxiuqinia elliptica]